MACRTCKVPKAELTQQKNERKFRVCLFFFHFILHQNTCVFGGPMDPAESFGSSPISACFFFLARDHGWAKFSFSPLVPVRERKLVSENFHLALARHAERVRWTRAKVPVFGSFAVLLQKVSIDRTSAHGSRIHGSLALSQGGRDGQQLLWW